MRTQEPPRLLGSKEEANWLRCLQVAATLVGADAARIPNVKAVKAVTIEMADSLYHELEERCPR